tara:strand:+ start:204 stop:572 length:369 start_codon:yes stop_codon:yes gene_type:complete
MAKKKTRLEAALSAAGSALTEAAGGAVGSVLGSAGKKVGSAVLKSSGLAGNIVEKSLESVLKRKKKKTEAEVPDIGDILGNIAENSLLKKKKKKTEAERIREQSGAAVTAEELRRLQTKPLK